MAYYVYSLESQGDSNENTQYTIMLKKIEKISLLCLLTLRFYHSLAQNTHLELIFMFPKVFGPLKFYCMMVSPSLVTRKNRLLEHKLFETK